jgi:protocatechuate 3,4-dioxygenase beta subunit
VDNARLNRRDLLKRLGLVGIGGLAGPAWLAGIPGAARADAATLHVDPSSVDCVLLPSMTEGPYYFDANQLRSDITENRGGLPFRLRIGVVDIDDCLPIGNAIVDLWHCDALGLYSGYNQPGGDMTGEDFMRGIQITGADGFAEFMTVFPGWYPGRANHMHLKVRFDQSTYITSQLFFPQEIGDLVQTTLDPYRSRGANPTKNTNDGTFNSVANKSAVMVSMAPDGSSYVGTVTFGITGLQSAAEAAPPVPRVTLTTPFPNPTPSVTTLWLTLPRGEQRVRVAVYDVDGAERVTLHNGPLLGGRHAVELDGSELRPGTYVVRADVGNEILIETVTIVR